MVATAHPAKFPEVVEPLIGCEIPLPPALAARFDAVRRQVLATPRDPAELRREVLEMREKVRNARPVKDGRYDVKHSAGGMMDAEFAVQYLVLAHGQRHPALLDNAGNIALLQRAEAAGLLPAGVGQTAARAYRSLRRLQHRARLDEAPTQIEPDSVAAERLAGARVPDRFESQPVEFFRRVAQGYADRAAGAPQRFARIDAAQDRHRVWQQLTSVFVRKGWLAIMVASQGGAQ